MASRPILLVLLASVSALPQTTTPPSTATRPSGERVWTFNFPRTPLEIGIDGDKTYSLENKSKLAIRSYQLGCVRELSRRYVVIVHRMAAEDTEIAPGEARGVMAFHQNLDRAACERKSARLTVVEVDFENGKQWQAPAKVQED